MPAIPMGKKTVKFPKKKSSDANKKVSKQEVNAIVKMAIHKEIENKSRQDVNYGQSFYYPAQGTDYDESNTIQISPGSVATNILQGVADGQRVGNSIKIVKCTFKAIFHPTPYSLATNPDPDPVHVTLILFYDRRTPTQFPIPRTDFFQFNSSTSAILGDLTDNISTVNKDAYRVLASKTFKLGFAKYDGDSASSAFQAFANNDFKYNKLIDWDVTKYLVSNVKYNDNNGDPTTRGLWMQVLISPGTGNFGLAGVIPASASVYIDTKYEDA